MADELQVDCWRVPPQMQANMHDVAARLRADQTIAEMKLWAAIRNRQVNGRKFRRQVPRGAYVVDFFCADERLVVEVDGPIHEFPVEADTLRQQAIEAMGIRVLRFTNDEVIRNLTGVLDAITTAFAK